MSRMMCGSRNATKGRDGTMRGRTGRRSAGRRRDPASGGAFQLGRLLVAALVIIVLIALLVALLD